MRFRWDIIEKYMRNTWVENMRKVTRGGSENFVFTENFQIDNVPGLNNILFTIIVLYYIIWYYYIIIYDLENNKNNFGWLGSGCSSLE